jgi:hypothetical protein
MGGGEKCLVSYLPAITYVHASNYIISCVNYFQQEQASRRNASVSLPIVPVVPKSNTEDVRCLRNSWLPVSRDVHVATTQGAAFFGWRTAGKKRKCIHSVAPCYRYRHIKNHISVVYHSYFQISVSTETQPLSLNSVENLDLKYCISDNLSVVCVCFFAWFIV